MFKEDTYIHQLHREARMLEVITIGLLVMTTCLSLTLYAVLG